MVGPTAPAPRTSALAVSTDRLPHFNADRAHRAADACRHDWVEVESCEFGCTRCGATYSYDNDPVQVRQAAAGLGVS
jgi:hypothetical protein